MAKHLPNTPLVSFGSFLFFMRQAKAPPLTLSYRLDKGPCHAMIAAQFNQSSRPFLMSFISQISEDLKNAMRAKDTVALNVIRNLKSALKYAAIEKLGADGELGDTDALAVVRKEIKKLQDSVDGAEKAGRPEAVEAAKAEIAVLDKYLPAAMSTEDLGTLVETVIAELGATSKKDMGGVMKVLQERVAGRADSKSISTEVAKRLA